MQLIIFAAIKITIVVVHTNLEYFKVKNPIVTIGVFDGVHLGHRTILNHLIQKAKEQNGESVVITMWPHPRVVLNKDLGKLTLLNSMSEKQLLLDKLGIDHLIVLPFTKEFASLTSCEFIEKFLVEKIGVKHLIVGYNHHFGRDREGGFEYLESCAAKFEFSIEKLDAFSIEEDNISSTKIREALVDGEMEKANRYLGYEYYISGEVVRGEQIGRKLGFPTANIQIDETYKHIPKNGVYAVRVILKDKTYKGMLNIGKRPTVNKEGSISVEVHILDFNEDIYNSDIKLTFIKRIRDEKKFGDLKDLTNQLFNDKATVLQLFREA